MNEFCAGRPATTDSTSMRPYLAPAFLKNLFLFCIYVSVCMPSVCENTTHIQVFSEAKRGFQMLCSRNDEYL